MNGKIISSHECRSIRHRDDVHLPMKESEKRYEWAHWSTATASGRMSNCTGWLEKSIMRRALAARRRSRGASDRRALWKEASSTHLTPVATRKVKPQKTLFDRSVGTCIRAPRASDFLAAPRHTFIKDANTCLSEVYWNEKLGTLILESLGCIRISYGFCTRLSLACRNAI
jgi:hypothetical protein